MSSTGRDHSSVCFTPPWLMRHGMPPAAYCAENAVLPSPGFANGDASDGFSFADGSALRARDSHGAWRLRTGARRRRVGAMQRQQRAPCCDVGSRGRRLPIHLAGPGALNLPSGSERAAGGHRRGRLLRARQRLRHMAHGTLGGAPLAHLASHPGVAVAAAAQPGHALHTSGSGTVV